MQIVGPTTLTVGQANPIVDPSEGSGGPASAACQIQNASPYQLAVTAAGDVLSIQPFTAQTVEISGQPITVIPLAGTGAGVCNVTFVFLLTTAANTGVALPSGTWVETPPQQDGPLTAAAIFAATQGTVTQISTGIFTLTGVNHIASLGPFVAKLSFGTLVLIVFTDPVAPAAGFELNAQTLLEDVVVSYVPGQSKTLWQPPGAFAQPTFEAAFYLPTPVAAGESFGVDLTGNLDPGVSFSYVLMGTSAPMASVVTPNPGNPLGTFDVGGATTAVATNIATGGGIGLLTTTPPAGTALRLHRFIVVPQAAAPWSGNIYLRGLVSNFVYADLAVVATLDENLDGQIVHEGLEVINFTSSIMQFAGLTYDPIALPIPL